MQMSIEEASKQIASRAPRRFAVLTGAGISAESGVPTFRGAGGLWENYRSEDLATPEAFARDPELVWRWYEWRREKIRNVEPNAAHRALAELETIAAERGGSLTLVTQNVDELHTRGGSRNVIELHGSIVRVRCVSEGTRTEAPQPFPTLPPRCACGALLRPDVVWFGEMLPPGALEAAADAVASCDVFFIIGTSGVVYPAAGLIHEVRRGISVEINPEETPLTPRVDVSIRSSAAAAVPAIVAAVRRSS